MKFRITQEAQNALESNSDFMNKIKDNDLKLGLSEFQLGKFSKWVTGQMLLLLKVVLFYPKEMKPSVSEDFEER